MVNLKIKVIYNATGVEENIQWDQYQIKTVFEDENEDCMNIIERNE